jgi:hypothetical protein
VLYVSVGTYNGHGLGHARWVALPLSAAQRSLLALSPEANAVTDPLALLRVLAALRAPARRIASGTVDGVPSTEYRVRSDLALVLQASAPGVRVPAGYNAVNTTLDVWLDARGRPVRVIELLAAISPRGPVTLSNVTDFTSYGAPTAIRRPARVRVARALPLYVPAPLVGAPTRAFESLLGRD